MNAARLRLFAKGLTPPLLWQALKRAKDGAEPPPGAQPAAPPRSEPPEWEYVPEGWARRSDPRVKGWNVDAIVAAYRAKWPSYVRALEGSRPLGVYAEVVEGGAIRRGDAVRLE